MKNFKNNKILVLSLCLIIAGMTVFFVRLSLDHDKGILYQISTINALMKGCYEGSVNISELKKHGDFGIGTFNDLDGEMVEIDHAFYQIKSDGKSHKAKDSQKTPFCMVTFFNAGKEIMVNEPLDCKKLENLIDASLSTKNTPYAIRIDGKFDYVKIRSVPRQKKPYPPLAEAAKEQSVFELHDISGTVAGFRIPEYLEKINVAGYHWHFITKDRKLGGHLFACQMASGRIRISAIKRLAVSFPQSNDFFQMDLSGSPKEDINAVEKSK